LATRKESGRAALNLAHYNKAAQQCQTTDRPCAFPLLRMGLPLMLAISSGLAVFFRSRTWW
jgi:hypothetical protein